MVMIAMLARKDLYYEVENHDGKNRGMMVRREGHYSDDEDNDSEDEGQ